MFDRVGAPNIDVYERISGVYLGKTVFRLTPDVEQALLQIVNGEGMPKAILLQGVDFFQASDLYVPPNAYERYQQIGVIHAMFRDSETNLWIPTDIYLQYEGQVSEGTFDDMYHFDGVEYSNIEVEDVKFVPHGAYSSAG